MAFYDSSNSWSGSPAGRQGPWDPAASRPGTTQVGPPDESGAQPFYYQYACVNRAVETWRKSSKAIADPRMGLGPRFPPSAEFDPMRPAGGHVPSFLAPQRFSARPTEADPALQAKRRMAAQRERELRNYHQEQQFQKHLSAAKSDRSMSPNTGMSEDERRDLIARQHRALYGAESHLYSSDPSTTRAIPQDARVTAGGVPGGFRRASPYDTIGLQSGGRGNESAVVMPSREGKDFPPSTSSPASNANNNSLNLSESTQQQSSRTSNSSPGASPPRDGSKPPPTSAGNVGNVAPIGTRPTGAQQQAVPQPNNLQKRSTTPLAAPLSYGFSAEPGQGDKTSSGSDDKGQGSIRGPWSNSSGVWGGKGGLGVQAKVWG